MYACMYVLDVWNYVFMYEGLGIIQIRIMMLRWETYLDSCPFKCFMRILFDDFLIPIFILIFFQSDQPDESPNCFVFFFFNFSHCRETLLLKDASVFFKECSFNKHNTWVLWRLMQLNVNTPLPTSKKFENLLTENCKTRFATKALKLTDYNGKKLSCFFISSFYG